MKDGEKWFPDKIRSNSFSIHTSKGRTPASELELLRGGLPSEVALQEGSLESKILYQVVGADLKNRKYIFGSQ